MDLQTLILIDTYSNPVLIFVPRHSENQVFSCVYATRTSSELTSAQVSTNAAVIDGGIEPL